MTIAMAAAAACMFGDGSYMVGRRYDAAARSDLRERGGASGTIRVVRPGDAVTQDWVPSRVTVTLDASGKVTRVSCG